MNKKQLLTRGFIIVLGIGLVIGLVIFLLNKPKDFGSEANAGPEIDFAFDIVGTRIGTTTTPELFHGGHTVASSTYRVGAGGADQLILTLLAVEASSTPSGSLSLSFLGSNDFNCMTATTSPDFGNPILTTDINWYDIGDHVAELAGTVTIPVATSTLNWLSIETGTSRDIVLENLDYQCITVELSASSTSLLIQGRLKN